MKLAEALSPIVDFVYPPRCQLCGGSVAAQSGLCAECWAELSIPGTPACASCQRPFSSSTAVEDGAICAACLAAPPRHDGIAAATLYNDASRQLVLALKHGKRIGLAGTMARLIALRLPEPEHQWLIVPVPLHRWRIWGRGFNQAALLAREAASIRRHELAVDVLLRTKATPSLGGLGRKARARALGGAITVNPARVAMIRDRDIILIDDVLTTGSTSKACVSALKKAGAGRVVIGCFARVLSELEPGSIPRTLPQKTLVPGDEPGH
ncbi:MAG TPA: ComF family protein [Alteraurantiacibacter sp.]